MNSLLRYRPINKPVEEGFETRPVNQNFDYNQIARGVTRRRQRGEGAVRVPYFALVPLLGFVAGSPLCGVVPGILQISAPLPGTYKPPVTPLLQDEITASSRLHSITALANKECREVQGFPASCPREEDLDTKNESKPEYRWPKPIRRQSMLPTNLKIFSERC
jgi:hypothetical protein